MINVMQSIRMTAILVVLALISSGFLKQQKKRCTLIRVFSIKAYSSQQLKRIVDSLHFRSEREKLHAQNVRILSEKIASQLGLATDEVYCIRGEQS